MSSWWIAGLRTNSDFPGSDESGPGYLPDETVRYSPVDIPSGEGWNEDGKYPDPVIQAVDSAQWMVHRIG
jgi:hypothetical protein